MKGTRIGIIALAAGLGLAGLAMGTASADSVSIGISTPSVNLGLQIGTPPPLVAVPGVPVYHAPSVPDNYFVYGGYYYLFHGGTWFYSARHNGPWASLVIHQVPQPILAVPVTYYKRPPSHWKKQGPPPWAEAHGYKKAKDHGKHGDHDKHTGRGKHKGKNNDD
jgi:hypothetical protein